MGDEGSGAVGERGLLAAMTEGLDEGLLLVDAEKRILITNTAFRRIFQLGFDPLGHRVSEVIRDPEITAHLLACLESDDDRRETVSGPPGTNRSYELHATSLMLPGSEPSRGALVLLFDITRLEALEHVRQRFIADVSHELRTPVTSIKGAVETLLDGVVVDEGIRPFLEIALRQADRMSELIADLTDLSRMETGAIELDVAPTDVSALFGDVAAAMKSRHSRREVDVRCAAPAGFTVIADHRRLEQMLINLVDNGVKYTPDGGSVTMSAFHGEGYDVIRVTDTGCGIPDKSLEKVFTRFYRVDKARSRELGGTGLGLAIVKHLVRLHHGSVHVDSEEGAGARFEIHLPPSGPGSSGQVDASPSV